MILCGSLPDTHSSTTLLSLSNTWIVAPSISFPAISTLLISTILSIISTFWISFLFVTSNSTSVATTYPSGAYSSCKIYFLPSSIPFMLWLSFVDVQLSITFPSLSVTTISAPSISFPPISAFVIVTILSIILTCCTFVVLSTLNSIVEALTYPSGAISSFNL